MAKRKQVLVLAKLLMTPPEKLETFGLPEKYLKW
jgi:hypothetical protein